METGEIILLAVFVGLMVFLIGIYIGVAVAMDQDEEKKKERWRKTEAYKLGREEERRDLSRDNPSMDGYNNALEKYSKNLKEENEILYRQLKATKNENQTLYKQLNDLKQNLNKRR